MPNDSKPLNPEAKPALNKLKLAVADETLGRETGQPVTAANYEQVLDRRKWEVADDLGLKEKIAEQGWENMTTGEVGKIGGQIGGKIGGHMVRELISRAESDLESETAGQPAKGKKPGFG